jgi:hypothetical protein
MASAILAEPTSKAVTSATSKSDMFASLDRSKMLTEPTVAAILCIKPRTLRKRRNASLGPAYIRFGRVIRYRVEDVERYILDHIVDYRAEEIRQYVRQCVTK